MERTTKSFNREQAKLPKSRWQPLHGLYIFILFTCSCGFLVVAFMMYPWARAYLDRKGSTKPQLFLDRADTRTPATQPLDCEVADQEIMVAGPPFLSLSLNFPSMKYKGWMVLRPLPVLNHCMTLDTPGLGFQEQATIQGVKKPHLRASACLYSHVRKDYWKLSP